MYPHLQLSASFSEASPSIGIFWSIMAGLSAPIFHSGALMDNQRASVDGYQALLPGYKQTLVISLGQVADTLQAIHAAPLKAGSARRGTAFLTTSTSADHIAENFANSLLPPEAKRAMREGIAISIPLRVGVTSWPASKRLVAHIGMDDGRQAIAATPAPPIRSRLVMERFS